MIEFAWVITIIFIVLFSYGYGFVIGSQKGYYARLIEEQEAMLDLTARVQDFCDCTECKEKRDECEIR